MIIIIQSHCREPAKQQHSVILHLGDWNHLEDPSSGPNKALSLQVPAPRAVNQLQKWSGFTNPLCYLTCKLSQHRSERNTGQKKENRLEISHRDYVQSELMYCHDSGYLPHH